MFILLPKQLDRVLNNDFRSSSLYLNLKSADKKIQNRYTKIEELNKSIHEFSGEEKIELTHQVIVEKKEYIKDYMNGMNHNIISKENSKTIMHILVIRATIVFQNIVIVALA